MDFDYSEDQKILQQSIKSLLQKKVSLPVVREFMRTDQWPADIVQMLAQQGLLGLAYESKENIDASLVYSVLTAYESGRALLPFPILESHVASYVIAKYSGNETLEQELSSGAKLFTVAWNREPHVVEGAGTVRGTFSYVSFAAHCDYMLALLRLKDGKQAVVLIDLKDHRVRIQKLDSMDQTYPLYSVTLDRYEFQPKDVLAVSDGDQLKDEMGMLARLLISAEAIGGSEEMLEKTVEYTKQRVQFEQPIAKFQAVKHKAAEMYVLVETSRAALKYATWAVSTRQTDEMKKAVYLLKSYVSDSCNAVMGIAIQLHGGTGFTWESDVHLYLKRARRISVMHGDAYANNRQLFTSILLESEAFAAVKGV